VTAPERKFGGYVHARNLFMLSQACAIVSDAFGHPPYHVGSSLYRPDFHDVDVRLILPDDEYNALFPGMELGVRDMVHARWSLICSSVSVWLSQASGLDVDFQIQQQTDANKRYPGERHPLGLYLNPETAKRSAP
jgi:hypothetical protein